MQVLNSYQYSKMRPELVTNHERKPSPSLQNKRLQNTEVGNTQVPAGKFKDDGKQERSQGLNGYTDSNQKAKLSAFCNKQTSHISSNSVSQERFEIDEHPEEKKATSNNDSINHHINDFTFACSHPESPVHADKLFHNGQIRPVYKADNVDKKKVVVEERDCGLVVKEPAGPYCEWSPEQGKKVGSTGNTRRWKLKDLVMGSKSEGDRKKAREVKGKKNTNIFS